MILICFGTRPEWLKIKPIVEKLDRSSYLILFTAQHPLDVPYDYKLHIENKGNRLDDIISTCLLQFPNDDRITSVMVHGDTATSFGCALAGFHRRLPIYHIEAGLRTYSLDHPYPEEGYRQMISRLTTYHLCPTQHSVDNLKKEQVSGDIFLVGNTVLDGLLQYKNQTTYDDIVLVTLHRRENHSLMKDWFTEINFLAKHYPTVKFIIPLHKNPNVYKWKHLLTNLTVTEPLPRDGIIDILKRCKLVITDSGGLQEEASFFNKKIIVCRQTTERPEGIDSLHSLLCTSPTNLQEIFTQVYQNYDSVTYNCPYGDGNTSSRISQIINDRE